MCPKATEKPAAAAPDAIPTHRRRRAADLDPALTLARDDAAGLAARPGR